MTSSHRLSNAGDAIPSRVNGANGSARNGGRGAINATCPDCRSIFRIDLGKVPPGGIFARCMVCGGVIPVSAPRETSSEGEAPAGPAIVRFEAEDAAFDWFALAESIEQDIKAGDATFAPSHDPFGQAVVEAPAPAPAEPVTEEYSEPPLAISDAMTIEAPIPERVRTPSSRVLYLEEVEVKSSRLKGLSCRVTLRRGEEVFTGESDGFESDKSRVELSARAAFLAVALCDHGASQMALEGARLITAFERRLVLVGVTARMARTSVLLTGRCEIKESLETASALAVLNATNRWMERVARNGDARRTRRLTPPG